MTPGSAGVKTDSGIRAPKPPVPYLPPKYHEFTLKMPAPCQVCGPPRGYIARHWMDGLGGNQLGRGPVHMAVTARQAWATVVGKTARVGYGALGWG